MSDPRTPLVVDVQDLYPGAAPGERWPGLRQWLTTYAAQIGAAAWRYYQARGRGLCVVVDHPEPREAWPVKYLAAAGLDGLRVQPGELQAVVDAVATYDPETEAVFLFRIRAVWGADMVFLRQALEPGPAVAARNEMN